MKISDDQIRTYFKAGENISYRKSHLQETIRKSKMAFYEGEAEEQISGPEFVYQQSKYIHKRWWVLQGSILVLLWLLLEVSEGGLYVRKCMGAAAPLFAVLLLPELWKNRNADAMEIEGTAYYSLRQVYAARMFLCALVDFLLLCFFLAAAILTGKMLIEEIIIQFFLPYTVTCCICFRTLYSRRAVSEALAVLLCAVWCVLWIQIGLSEKIYEAISPLVWFLVIAAAVFYIGYCIYRGQKTLTFNGEVRTVWN